MKPILSNKLVSSEKITLLLMTIITDDKDIARVSTAWKVSKCRVFCGLYFPVFGLNTRKHGPEKSLHLNTFHTVLKWFFSNIIKTLNIPQTNHSKSNFENVKNPTLNAILRYRSHPILAKKEKTKSF